jgi:hypothetical protein
MFRPATEAPASASNPGSGRPDGQAIPRRIDPFAERLRPIAESSQDDLSYK